MSVSQSTNNAAIARAADAVGEVIELPPLPELPRPARVRTHIDSQGRAFWDEPFFSEEQMRAYALAALAQLEQRP